MTVEVDSARNRVSSVEIVTAARGWIGTPYEHQARTRSAGTECLGFLRGISRELYGFEPEAPPAYTPDWSQTTGEEAMLAAAARNLRPILESDAREGDVVVMRMRPRSVAKHIGVLAQSSLGHATLIHAYSGHGVVESPLTPDWRARIAAYFRFPDRSD